MGSSLDQRDALGNQTNERAAGVQTDGCDPDSLACGPAAVARTPWEQSRDQTRCSSEDWMGALGQDAHVVGVDRQCGDDGLHGDALVGALDSARMAIAQPAGRGLDVLLSGQRTHSGSSCSPGCAGLTRRRAGDEHQHRSRRPVPAPMHRYRPASRAPPHSLTDGVVACLCPARATDSQDGRAVGRHGLRPNRSA